MLTPRRQIWVRILEVVLVVGVVLLLTVHFALPSQSSHAQATLTRANLQRVRMAVWVYLDTSGEFPDDCPLTGELQGLVAQVMPEYVPTEDTQDGWKRPLLYLRRAEDDVEYLRIFSLGADGTRDVQSDSDDGILMDIGFIDGQVRWRDPKRSLRWAEP